MTNPYYNVSGTPGQRSAGSSSPIRSEYASIAAAFDKLPTFSGNANRVITVNSGATALTASSVLSLSGSTAAVTGDLTVSGSATAASFAGPLTGSATTLATPRTISITGDLAYTSPAFDGSGNVTAAGTLATVNSNIGTFAAATLNAKGLATAGANLSGDATTSGAVLTLATVNANVGTFGSSTLIPVLTVNEKGLITAATNANVIAPAGTLTGTTLAAGVTASSLTSLGTLATLTVAGAAALNGTVALGDAVGDTITLNGTFGGGGRLAAGTYTPTVTAVSNCTSPVASLCQFTRINDIVQVHGVVTVSITVISTTTRVGVSLPVASNFVTAITDCEGFGIAGAALVGVFPDTTNKRIELSFTSLQTGSTGIRFCCSYQVLS
jgi:hypothetical protein